MSDKMDPLDSGWTKWKTTGSQDDLNSLVSSFDKDIDYAISARGGEKESPVSRGTARRLVIDAVKSYNPKQGTKIRTWVSTQLQQLGRKLRESRFTVKVPELAARRSFELKNEMARVEAETGFEPSVSDLADKLGISPSKISRLLASSTPEVLTEDTNVEEDDKQFVHDMVYHSLPPKDKSIMQYLFGYGGSKLLPGKEVARRLKITPAAVSQRAAKIRAILQEAETL